ncbi:glutamine amidotransferase family protein [Thermoproteota archaeon]
MVNRLSQKILYDSGKSVQNRNNPYNDDKVIDSCSVFGMMDNNKRLFHGDDIIEASTNMIERTNGLGSGYAVYGLYPKYWNNYALHIMYDNLDALRWGSKFIESNFEVVYEEDIPTDKYGKKGETPIMRRYFTNIDKYPNNIIQQEDFLVEKCMEINNSSKGAYVFSSGKNMGVFKGIGWPREIAKYFRLSDYKGYLWLSHSRFPTNSNAWWGGAHPFAYLDTTIVHNGEISSYGSNKRYLEMLGYKCTFKTDTEIFSFALDYLLRKNNLPAEIVAKIFAPAFWKDIDKMPESEKNLMRRLRITYGNLLMNGPFSIIFAKHDLIVGLTDRIKLRPFVAARKKDMMYLSSEEAAIKKICSDIDEVHHPQGGKPIIAKCGKGFAS